MTDPYPQPVVIPYQPDSPDNPPQGPADSSPPGPPLVTVEQSKALVAEQQGNG